MRSTARTCHPVYPVCTDRLSIHVVLEEKHLTGHSLVLQKKRTNEQQEEGKAIIQDMVNDVSASALVCFTDGSCLPNPGPCGANPGPCGAQPLRNFVLQIGGVLELF